MTALVSLLLLAVSVKHDHTALRTACSSDSESIAAWRSDDSRRALDYWRGSLDLQPDPEIERLYRKVEKETRSDQSTDKIVGLRVLVRYDPAVVPATTAREMAAALDDEFIRISTQ